VLGITSIQDDYKVDYEYIDEKTGIYKEIQ